MVGSVVNSSITVVGSSTTGFVPELRGELLNGEIFYTLRETEVLIEEWRETYNQIRTHSSLDY
jgi:transposase InsO family protein